MGFSSDLPYAFSPLPQDVCKSLPSKPDEEQACEMSSHESEDISENLMNIIRLGCLLMLMTFLVALWSLGSSFRIELPVLQSNSFTISNFNVSSSKLVAILDTDVTFGHCERESSAEAVHYNRISAYIFYNDRENMLARASVEPFSVGAKEKKTVHFRFENMGWQGDQPTVDREMMRAIGRELENGMVHFGFRLDLWVRFEKWGFSWAGNYDRRSVESYCWDFLAGIEPATGRGRLISGKGVYCSSG